jgi:hypothetical protein
MRKSMLGMALMPLLVATASSTPEPSPSSTASPSRTPRRQAWPALSPVTVPEYTLTPTPTFTLPSLTPTPIVPPELDCELNWQSPGSGITFAPRESFTVGWNVTNTGTANWGSASTEFTYVSGARIHHNSSEPLETSVSPGQAVVLTAEMRAPRNPSKYTTTWGLRRGDTFFCSLTVSIYVE